MMGKMLRGVDDGENVRGVGLIENNEKDNLAGDYCTP